MLDLYIKRPYQSPIIHITTDDNNLYNTLIRLYKPFIFLSSNDLTEIMSKSICEILFLDRGLSSIYSCDGEAVQINNNSALQMIENKIYESTIIDKEILAIHAAVSAYQNKAYLLVGYTEAGKSTLSAYLSCNGFEYLSDDLALIKRDNTEVVPFPRPIQLREGGSLVLKSYGIDLERCDQVHFGDIYRIILTPEAVKSKSYKIGGICFIRRTKNKNSLKRLSKQQAFINLMKNQFVYTKSDPGTLGIIARLSEMNVFELGYSDMNYVKNIIIEGKLYE